MASEGKADAAEKRVLVTGGIGFIGSHTVVELLNAGYKVTIVDNLCNSNTESLNRVKEITGKTDADVDFFEADILDGTALEEVFKAHTYESCVHFAALKAVGESVALPLKYYKNNLSGTFQLLETMQKYGCKRIVFSSSATVYGSSPSPLTEDSKVGEGITNPYGQTKYMMECVLRDFQKANPDWGVVLLRYFNPVGAHPSGRIGEDPQGPPNNLMPFVQQVAVGRRPKLTVFGDDYDTVDGTGVRDYIHVMDLANGHLKALEYIDGSGAGCEVFNLGTGTGYSVLQMVKAMEKASGKEIPYEVAPRRPGDLGSVYAEPTKAKDVLKWEAKLGLERMCEDAWRWQSSNPYGFGSAEDAK